MNIKKTDWVIVILGEKINGKWIDKEVVKMCCPKCGVWGYLDEHTIDSSGVVSQSVVCDYKGCDFHDNVQLEDWHEDRVLTEIKDDTLKVMFKKVKEVE